MRSTLCNRIASSGVAPSRDRVRPTKVGPQPFQGLSPQPGSLLARPAAQRGGEGGPVTVTGQQITRQVRVGGERFGKETHGGCIQLLVAAEVGQLDALGGAGGPGLAFQDGRQAAVQLDKAFAALDPLGRRVGPVLSRGAQVVAGLEFRQGCVEVPLAEEDVPQVAMALGVLRIEADDVPVAVGGSGQVSL